MCEDSVRGDTIEGPDVVGLMCPIIGAEFTSRLADGPTNAQARDPTHGLQRANELRRLAVEAARHAVLAMRASLEIGDDAFHQVEEELNWLEMATRERPE